MFAARPSAVRTALLLLLAISSVLGLGRAWAASGSSRWGADYFPNVPLVTQDGKTVRFYDDLIKNKVVAINFIFTSCRNTCPAETAKLRQVQQLLGDRVGKDVFMYSISIDPEHDTPEVLKEYSEKFLIEPGWLFLTGKEDDITLLRKKLGLFIEEIQDDPEDHNVSLIVGNQATGRWMKRTPYDNPRILARLLGDSLHNFKVRREGTEKKASYADASRLAKFSRGDYLFRTRCNSCHTVGGGDGVGPDLLNVTTKRDGDWLARWMRVPDEMLAEKDPIAMELFAKYREVPMPNLQLNEADAASLIDYLHAESRRVVSSEGPDGRARIGRN
ncbi:MAG: SCO family protein [Candidatus Binatia bacterium]